MPADARPLVEASVRMHVAVESLKTEMAKRMGPPKLDEEGWNIGQMPDGVLNALRETKAEGPTVGLVAKDPRGGGDATIAWMIRVDGTWTVPAGVAVGTDPTPGKFEVPDADL